MKVLKKFAAGVGVAGAVVLIAAPAAVATPGGESLDAAAVDRYVAEQVDNTGLAGVSFAVTKGDRIVHVGGYGHDSTGAAVTAKTPMRIASLTKSFTALAVMQLVDQGKVKLDTPISAYLPDFRPADPRGAKITVKMLLNQSSGLAGGSAEPKTAAQAAAPITPVLSSEPGTRYAYANVNYRTLGRLVERVSGLPYETYLKQHVFGPAGMTGSSAPTSLTTPVPGLAEGHVFAYGQWLPRPELPGFGGGAGTIVSTAEDMAHWLIVQNNQGRAGDGTPVVTAASTRQMHTMSDPDRRYGFGWGSEAEMPGVLTHAGNLKTFTAYQAILPGSGYGIALLADTGSTPTTDDSYGIMRGLIAMAQGRTPEDVAPVMFYYDGAVAALTALALALGIGGLFRARRWAARRVTRPTWRNALALLRHVLPLAILLACPALIGFLVRAEVSWTELAYVFPIATLVLLGAMTLMSLSVLTTKIVHLVRLRRS